MSSTVRIHGLAIASDFPVHAPTTDGPPDVKITRAQDAPAPDVDGRVIASFEASDGGLIATETHDGYVLRFTGTCDFIVAHTLDRIEVRVHPKANEQIIPLLITGYVCAFVLTMRGACVLHASALDINGRAVAFIGPSGAGKSTLAALLARDGARVITDDLLHVDLSAEAPRCHLGSPEIRLREGAAALADGFASHGFSPDGRTTFRTTTGPDLVRLDAIIVPEPSRSLRHVQVQRVPRAQAVVELLRGARGHWDLATTTTTQMRTSATLARAVPVWRAEIPWGPPFAVDLARQLLTCVMPITTP